ncbi:hypothetical protein THRCLA_06621 [Thraustotheca clavata]|uniref:LicD/FKTN/FKRP nucleotidyltransferase domain-containing protein n=1 Tax=Thraustotheca clavata TaxID=74557 RepID=A0A1V9ZLT0_9STRA|nr:hypothetical protein THRCLA_06621 [Thraustotheca clavata]
MLQQRNIGNDGAEDETLLELDEEDYNKDGYIHPLNAPSTPWEKFTIVVLSIVFISIGFVCVHTVFTTKICVHIPNGHRETRFRAVDECFDHEDINGMLRGLAQSFIITLSAHEIEYWLDSGTLLGAKRTSSLNPNDLDLDIGMSLKAFQKLNDTLLPFPQRYKLEILDSVNYPSQTRDEALPGRYIDQVSGLYLDIFVFLPSIREDDGELMMGPIASGCWHECVACPGHPKHFIIPENWVYPLMPCMFEGVKARCPNSAKAYLTHLYGEDYMTRSWDFENYIT